MIDSPASQRPDRTGSRGKRGLTLARTILAVWAVCGCVVHLGWSVEPPITLENRAAVAGTHRQGLDRYDLRAAEDAGRSEKLSLVQKSFARQHWDEGVLQLQVLLNDEHDSLVRGVNHEWRPVSEVALELVHQFPDDAQRAYDSRFQAVAERDLQQALQTHDVAGLLRVSQRYLLTTAGQLACREMIELAIDHGNGDALS